MVAAPERDPGAERKNPSQKQRKRKGKEMDQTEKRKEKEKEKEQRGRERGKESFVSFSFVSCFLFLGVLFPIFIGRVLCGHMREREEEGGGEGDGSFFSSS